MLILISPAKTLNMESPVNTAIESLPGLLDQSSTLVETLKKMKSAELARLMGISPKLAQLNFGRFQDWQMPFDPRKTRPALFAFRGEVFTGINVDTFSGEDLAWAQDHLRILSGLYGLLRPMDRMLAYRLEMGTKLKVGNHKDLYGFWGDTITGLVNESLVGQNDRLLINLASNEYFKALNPKKLDAQVFTPVFKDYKSGNYRVISFFAKKARGLMTRFILLNRISNVGDLKHFEEDGYYFNESLSTDTTFTFTRG